jgi:hypothetical protein
MFIASESFKRKANNFYDKMEDFEDFMECHLDKESFDNIEYYFNV